jgi:voltage-gated potassium channel
MADYRNVRIWFGMAGVPEKDEPIAYIWERRLHWVMVMVALLSIPAYFLESIDAYPILHAIGRKLDWFIFLSFSMEFLWMLWVTRQWKTYFMTNWLDLLIIFGAAGVILGWEGEWAALARLLRVAIVALVMARLMGSLRKVLSPSALPMVLGLGLITLAFAGAGFYWLEPTVHTYAEGLWLAFTSGATVGYGDIVPTTPASRLFAAFIVLIGYTILSLVTASIAAFFIGEDEKLRRREMHEDIKALRKEVSSLRDELRQNREKEEQEGNPPAKP